MKISNEMVVITQKRYKELLKKENRNKREELKNILSYWNMINNNVKTPEDFKGISIKKVIEGFESELKHLTEDDLK